MAKKKNTKKKSRCWTGYKPKPGSTPYAPGSCIKEANMRIGRVIADALDLYEAAPAIKAGIKAGAKAVKAGAKAVATTTAKKAARKTLDTVKSTSDESGGVQSSIVDESAWTRKEGQNPEGGLNAKGRASAKADGHNLKPPVSAKAAKKSKKKAARRKSFCARMKGMRKRQKASNNTGEDRLSKSLRKWDC